MRDFRADIEGLRAVAVLPIVLFHLDSTLCPGGFCGVDIFFVISGFLITRMIRSQGEAFSFGAFYLRRFWRLFPALIVTLTASLVAGWKLLGPDEYVRLAQSAVAAAFGVSNFHFLAAVDYFNASTRSHPLLHTWSLGLEEQFYLVWPLLLVSAMRRWKRPFWSPVMATAVLSFTAIALVQPAHPQLVFYMMPFRMFEFAIGASLVALEPHWRGLSPVAAALVGAIATAMLAFSFAELDGQTPWPGALTLIPAFATALFILVGGRGLWGGILGHFIPRFIGRISYSLYLVHWPLITFYRSYVITDPEPMELVMLGLLSVACGAVLYALVEGPFRLRGANWERVHVGRRSDPLPLVLPRTAIAAVVAVTSTTFLAGATSILASNGFPSRVHRASVQFLDKGLTFAGDLCSRKRARCVFGDRESARVVYVIGDSHALNLIHGLDGLFHEQGLRGIALYDHGCLFAFETQRFLSGVADEKCRTNVAHAYQYLSKTTDPVILAGDYAGYRNEIGPSGSAAPLRLGEAEYFAWLRERFDASLAELGAGKRVVVVFKQTYTTGVDLAKCLAQPSLAADAMWRDQRCKPLSLARVQEMYGRADRMIDEVVAGFNGAVAIDPKPLFCDAAGCATHDDSGGLYFRDAGHLTNAGSDFLIGRAKEQLLQALAHP